MIPINIVCLKWGTKYGSEYVNRLFFALKRHTNIPFTFHCFTEKPEKINPGVIIHPLPYEGLDGWWNKLYLFSKEIKIDGRIFYIDLDTIVTGNVDQIISYDKDFVVLRDFFTGLASGIKTNDYVGSGLMSFEAHKHSHMWDEFMIDPQGIINSIKPHGDQVWVMRKQLERVYWQDLFPNQIVSFKVHCREGLPADARIICYHGKPSIPDSITKASKAQWWTIPAAPWVADHWKDNV